VTDTAAYLREAREKRGLTLDDVEQATRIPRHYLEMMEGEGDTRLISDPLYLVHYVRRYAEHLQLDGTEQLAAQFIRENTRLQGSKRSRSPRKAEKTTPILPWLVLIVVVLGAGAAYIFNPELLSRTLDDQEARETAVITTAPVRDDALVRAPAENVQPAETTDRNPANDTMTVLQPEAQGIIDSTPTEEGAAMVSTESATSAGGGETTPVGGGVASAEPTEPAGPSESASAEASPRDVPSQQAESSPTAPAEAESEGQRLEIVATEKAWVRVIVDGQSPQDMMMQPGDSRTWSAEEQFVLTLGNAGGVDLTLNGKKLAPLGTSGQVVRNYQLPR